MHNTIIIPSKHSKFVSEMIKDLTNVKVLPIVDDNQGMKFYIDFYKNDYKFVGLGLLSEDSSEFDMSDPIRSFYNQFNLDREDLEKKYNL